MPGGIPDQRCDDLNIMRSTYEPPAAGPPSRAIPPAALPVPPTSGSGDPIGAARAGQPWAFDHLFKAHGRNVRAFAAARGADDPDGLTNEAFAEAFRALPGFRGGEAEFKGFVFHVARRRLIDDYRKRSRRPKSTPVTGRVDAAQPGDPFSEAIGTSAAMNLVQELTTDQRDVIFLRVLCDLSIEETAQALGKAPTAVKALQRRAIGSLRKKIEHQGVS